MSTSALPEGLSPQEIDAVVSERLAAGEDLYLLDEGALAELAADISSPRTSAPCAQSTPSASTTRSRSTMRTARSP
ncbi:MAG: hypothetical protein M3N37_04490 [Actinomycetota bacterium]|nr:hypothetical protein [Actinomycetota bacterium]